MIAACNSPDECILCTEVYNKTQHRSHRMLPVTFYTQWLRTSGWKNSLLSDTDQN